MSHLDLIATPKQAFNTYVAHLERSGLPQAKNTLAELRSAGNKQAQFKAYCAKFVPATETPTESEDSLVAQMKALYERLVNGETVEVAPAAKPRKRNKPKASAFGIGSVFSYAGQNGTSVWTVVADNGITKKSKQPAFMCLRNGASEPRAWSKSQVTRKLADGTITL